ncbi:hypothetical protein COE58_04500 [Bacillus cereus]|nr:hypothetical protein COL13_01275 [Bacillus cereus]PGZ63849.1 hypothetical protein COE58_04500 [Bacillus cereus]
MKLTCSSSILIVKKRLLYKYKLKKISLYYLKKKVHRSEKALFFMYLLEKTRIFLEKCFFNPIKSAILDVSNEKKKEIFIVCNIFLYLDLTPTTNSML